jgi:hypothetical protein
MALTAQAQFLRMTSRDLAVVARWQRYWVERRPVWEGHRWDYQPFEAGGIILGDVESEGTMTITCPATSITIPIFRDAIKRGYLVEITQYEFDPQQALEGPYPDQQLVAAYVGEVVGLGGSFSSLAIELGSALSPIGAQVPPRTMTTRLIGVPCQL